MLQKIRTNAPSGFQRRILLLLVLVVLGCLGSLPFASHLLVTLNNNSPGQTSSTRVYTNGQCTLRDTRVIYEPAGASVAVPNPLPGAWTQAGRGAQDYIKAFACAAAFVETYETFDYHQVHTLYAALPLLSADAQKRFYEGNSAISASIRTSSIWQKKLQQNKVIEVASVSVPNLLDSEYSQGILYLTLDVPYTVVEQIDGQTTTQYYNETVLLKSVSPTAQLDGIGWQVSDWRENA